MLEPALRRSVRAPPALERVAHGVGSVRGRAAIAKYSYRLVREEYYKFASSICPEPYDTLSAFGTLSQLSGDV